MFVYEILTSLLQEREVVETSLIPLRSKDRLSVLQEKQIQSIPLKARWIRVQRR